MEDANGQISNATESTVGQICPYSEDDMLGIEPLELRFPFERNKKISCSFQLTNNTDAYIAFDVLTSSPLPYSIQPKKDIVPPQSKRSVHITLQSQENAPRDVQRGNEFTVRSAKVNGGLAFEDISRNTFNTKTGDSDIVDEVNLDVVFYTKLKDTPLLDVHPRKLLFPFVPKKLVPCSLNMTNNTNVPMVFMLTEDMGKEGKRKKECFVRLPLCGMIPAQSTCTLVVTTQEKENLPEVTDAGLQLAYCKSCEFTNCFTDYDFRDASYGSEKHYVSLEAAYVAEGEMPCEEAIPPIIQSKYVEHSVWPIKALDVNPTEPWIMTGHMGSRVDIWDYETQKLVATVEVPNTTTTVVSVLFIVRKQWFVVMTRDGFIHVYDYKTEMQQIRSFSAGFSMFDTSVTSLAVHPTHPYVMSSLGIEIKVWDWDEGWKCIQTFTNSYGYFYAFNQIAFNPTDTNSIVAASKSSEVEVWYFDYPEPEYSLSGHSKQVNCLCFFTRDDQQFLVTGSSDKTAKIWNMQKQKCVKTLRGLSEVISVIFHPNLQLLIAGTKDGPFYLWSSTDFRLKSVLYGAREESYDNLAFSGSACLMESRRVAIAHGKLLTVVEIHDEEAVCSEGGSDDSILKITQETQDLRVK